VSDPRRHHYVFAHHEVRRAAQRFGADLVEAGREGRLTLESVWNRVGESLDEPDRRPATGLASTYHEIAGHRVLLVRLPSAHHPTEAHFVAIAAPVDDGRVRYLTLEYAVSPVDETVYTVFGEWDDQRHVNYGEGPAPDADAFLAAVAHRLAPGSVRG
jgi:hypothetical protein